MRVAFTKSEWLAVTVLYRSEQVDDLRRAVAILHTWRARMGNSLHVAAEMSELLLAAFIADKGTHANDWLAVFNLRLLYSAAVIRFVNYVNEMCQRKRPAKIMFSGLQSASALQCGGDTFRELCERDVSTQATRKNYVCS
ncbi:hypothetical protein Tcan_12926 [Toxocara canis]|uniref:Uncharacterized protein n=1 Tax=Toxocara canis TaxID=6265 RepID=A0A0B2VWV6_TOXCA|nr:hypothetical protein Tcan_12926 [Toxocara canis]